MGGSTPSSSLLGPLPLRFPQNSLPLHSPPSLMGAPCCRGSTAWGPPSPSLPWLPCISVPTEDAKTGAGLTGRSWAWFSKTPGCRVGVVYDEFSCFFSICLHTDQFPLVLTVWSRARLKDFSGFLKGRPGSPPSLFSQGIAPWIRAFSGAD